METFRRHANPIYTEQHSLCLGNRKREAETTIRRTAILLITVPDCLDHQSADWLARRRGMLKEESLKFKKLKVCCAKLMSPSES